MSFNKRKVFFIVFALVFSFFIILASNNVFQEDPGYFIVPHGDHNHYVPNYYDRNVSVHQFPQRAPREGERITPDGRIVRDMDTGIQFFENRQMQETAPPADFSPAEEQFNRESNQSEGGN